MPRFWKPACIALLAAVGGMTFVAHAADAPAREFSDDCYFMPADKAPQQKLDTLVGKPMPELQVADWINGEVKPEDLKGKVGGIDIWATWCGPCRQLTPALEKAVRGAKGAVKLVKIDVDKNPAYAGQLRVQSIPTVYAFKDGLVVVGVCSSANGQEKLADVVKSDGIKYPVAKDPGTKTAKAYNVGFYPTYVVIDRTGKVRAAGVTPKGVDTVIKKLLAESNVS